MGWDDAGCCSESPPGVQALHHLPGSGRGEFDHLLHPRFIRAGRFLKKRRQLGLTMARPRGKERLEFMSGKPGQWIRQSGLGDRPVEQRTGFGRESIEIEDKLEALPHASERVAGLLGHRRHKFFVALVLKRVDPTGVGIGRFDGADLFLSREKIDNGGVERLEADGCEPDVELLRQATVPRDTLGARNHSRTPFGSGCMNNGVTEIEWSLPCQHECRFTHPAGLGGACVPPTRGDPAMDRPDPALTSSVKITLEGGDWGSKYRSDAVATRAANDIGSRAASHVQM